jgi:ribosomal protein S18 acetylase RimI-like enzyme
MTEIVVLPLQKTRTLTILDVLTKAYTGNSAHIAIFGKDNFIGNELYFRLLLKNIKSDLFIAESAGHIAGVIGMEMHPRPVSPGSEKVQITEESLSVPGAIIARLKERQSIWDKLELKDRHYHFGPVAVMPEYQHQGVGGRMVEYCCHILDSKGESAYLETESLENFRFYSKYGFKVIHEMTLFEIPIFFMKRLPQPG